MEKVYKTKEAAEILRLHPKTLKRLLINGTIKGFRAGGTPQSHWRITESAINNYKNK